MELLILYFLFGSSNMFGFFFPLTQLKRALSFRPLSKKVPSFLSLLFFFFLNYVKTLNYHNNLIILKICKEFNVKTRCFCFMRIFKNKTIPNKNSVKVHVIKIYEYLCILNPCIDVLKVRVPLRRVFKIQ